MGFSFLCVAVVRVGVTRSRWWCSWGSPSCVWWWLAWVSLGPGGGAHGVLLPVCGGGWRGCHLVQVVVFMGFSFLCCRPPNWCPGGGVRHATRSHAGVPASAGNVPIPTIQDQGAWRQQVTFRHEIQNNCRIWCQWVTGA